MTDTIMVAVDDHPEHRAALSWAARRAVRDGARLQLVYVIERSWGDSPEEPEPRLVAAADSVLTEQRRIASYHVGVWSEHARSLPAARSGGTTPPAVEISARHLYGRVGSELASASHEADLLVVGSQSGAEPGRPFASSLAVRVAATALCPVAVIPHSWNGEGEGVVVGVDGGPASELAVAFAADEAAANGERLDIVCAGYAANPLLAGFVPELSVGDRRQRVVEDAARSAGEMHPELSIRTTLPEASPSRGLIEAAEGTGLLVVGTHNRHGVKRLMLGSVSHDILLNVQTPVVVARARREAALVSGGAR